MIIRFHIINLFFPYGAKNLEYMLNGEKVKLHRVKNYEEVENNVKRNFSNAITCSIDFSLKKDKDERVEFISKLNRLLSFCRGNTINYSYYEIIDADKIVEKTEIDAITAPYCSLELIPRWCVKETERFLNNALKFYDELNEIFSINKVSWEFPQTRNSSSFLSSRSLILTAVVEYILFNFNSKKNNMGLFREQDFHEVISPLKQVIRGAFKDRFGKKNSSKIHTIVKKIDNLNERTLNWKFQKLVKNYKLPISDREILRFKDIRDSLAHTLSFPQEAYKIDDWKFLVTLMDKIILGLFKYEGKYNNFHEGNESVFKLTS